MKPAHVSRGIYDIVCTIYWEDQNLNAHMQSKTHPPGDRYGFLGCVIGSIREQQGQFSKSNVTHYATVRKPKDS